jgi:hydroxymethylpyrimidine kinase/phosphomethylpyrimidine kinase
MKKFETVLSIAGVDPSGGAGIFADFRAIEAAGVRALGAVTALTVQTEDSFSRYEPTATDMLRDTISGMVSAYPGTVVKTGMLPTEEIIAAVAEELDSLEIETVVIDPVMYASVGARLVEESAETAIRDMLVQRATVITPNIHEAQSLTGVHVIDVESMEKAGRQLLEMGAESAVITGGHLKEDALDVLVTEEGVEHISAERLPGSVHGTGCSFASSIAAHLALGKKKKDAIKAAKDYVASLFSEQRWRAN